VEECARLKDLAGVEVEGIFTHCAAADSEEDFTMEQFDRFLRVSDGLKEKGMEIPIRHCAASAAMLNYPCMHLDMVRAGIILYGHFPEKGMEYLCDLRPVMTLKTRVAAVRRVPAGATVSYGRTARMEEETTLAVLPVGYADGFPRLLSNEGTVFLRGVPCPIVGRVCMDLCMVAVDGVNGVQAGEEVILYGAGPVSVEHAAELVGTIQYELLTSVTRRVRRVYR
jgi:alanine racemase